MNTVVTIALWFLAAFALVCASVIEPPESTKTGRQYVSAIRQMKWWHIPYWVASVALAFPLHVIGSSSRYAVYLVTLWLSKGLKKVAQIAAMDNRQPASPQVIVWGEVRP